MNFMLKNQLAECLAERKIRQSQLARRLRMSAAYVSRLRSGKIQPSIGAALRIAHYFGKPVEQIFQLVETTGKESNFPDMPPSVSGEKNNHGGDQNERK
jgi:putative transcriptional regulator